MKRNQFFALAGNFISRVFSSPLSFIVYFVLPPVGLIGIYYLMRLIPDVSMAAAGEQGIGFLHYFILLQGCLLTGLSLKDKDEGILLRIRTAPVHEFLYTVSSTTAAFFVLFLQSTVALLVVIVGLRIVPLNNFLPLLGVFSLFGFSAVGFGILLSGVASDTTQETILANVAVTLSSLLGGVFFPVKLMSPLMQRVAFIFPQYWGGKAVSAVLTGDISASLIPPLLVLFLYGVLSLVLFAYIRRREELGDY